MPYKNKNKDYRKDSLTVTETETETDSQICKLIALNYPSRQSDSYSQEHTPDSPSFYTGDDEYSDSISQTCRKINLQSSDDSSPQALPKPIAIELSNKFLSPQQQEKLQSISPYKVLNPLSCVKIDNVFYYVSPESRNCHQIKNPGELAGFNVVTINTQNDSNEAYAEEKSVVKINPEHCVEYKKRIFLTVGDKLHQITDSEFLETHKNYKFMRCNHSPKENEPILSNRFFKHKEAPGPSPLTYYQHK